MLEGLHALVTGGGSGIGAAIATALADAGAQVTITGRREDALKQVAKSRTRIHGITMDVADEQSVIDGTAEAVAKRGPIQICVANAGIAEGVPFHKTTTENWRKVLTTNLDGAYFTVRESLRSMSPTGYGRIITIASIAGLKGLKGAPAYTVSKHGLIGLTRSLSEELLGTGITVNALCPAYVETDIVRNNTKAISAATGMSEEDAMAVMVKTNRHRRLIEAEEVATAAIWLCNPASGSVNGQAIEIAGGQI